MKNFKKEFIELAISYKALRFGEFTLKSGRISPYFFNAGFFYTGEALAKIGTHYASAITQANIDFDLLFGPAYKGIPLVSSTAVALYQKQGRSIPWVFNRKEAKDHGEGGTLVGAPLSGKVLMIDDVMTAGTAIRESMHLIAASQATTVGVFVMLDRQERGVGNFSAMQEVAKEFDVETHAIITLNDLMVFLESYSDYHEHLENIYIYKKQYGIDV